MLYYQALGQNKEEGLIYKYMGNDKRQYKKTKICLLCILFMMIFSACGKEVADEEKIKADIENCAQKDIINESETIDSVAIEKRQTDKSNKLDKVWCKIVTKNADVSFEKEVVLEYGLYDKDGWLLDEIDVNPKNEWIIKPLRGTSKGEVLQAIKGQTVIVGTDTWIINDSNVIESNIDEQNTNLENKTDEILLSVTLEEDVERLLCNLTVEFTFDSKWKYYSMDVSDSEVEVRSDISPIVDKEVIMNIIEAQEIVVGKGNDTQKIKISSDEISDLTINGCLLENKGCTQKYDCEFELSKPMAQIKMNTDIRYEYSKENGWKTTLESFNMDVTELKLLGTWKGDGWRNHSIILTVTDWDIERNEIAALFEYIDNDYDKYSGSYYVSGSIDLENMIMHLVAKDWKREPKAPHPIDKEDIWALVYMDNPKMVGKGQRGYPFEIKFIEE